MIGSGRHDHALIALGDYWDDVVQGSPAERGDLEPALVATVDALHARDDALGADRVFAARLLANLERRMSIAPPADPPLFGSLPPTIMSASASPAGSSATTSRTASDTAKPSSARWFSTQLATAALVLLTLAGYVAFGVNLPGRFEAVQRLLRAPAPESTAIAPPDPMTQQGLLVQMTVTDLPPDADYTGIERWTYPPHSYPMTTSPHTGPMIIFVTGGQLTVSLDGEGAKMSVSDSAQPEATLATATGRIAAGDALLVPANARLTVSNDEATESTAIVVKILRDTVDDWKSTYNQTTITAESLVTGRGKFTAEPARVELRRATLQPGEQAQAPPDGTFQLVAAESKYLGYLGRAPDGTVTNLEKAPLGVLIVTIVQAV